MYAIRSYYGVITNIEKKLTDTVSPAATPQAESIQQAEAGTVGDHGVFNQVEDAVKAAYQAQADLMKNYRLEDREAMIAAIRQATLANKQELAQMIVTETKLGKLAHKLDKLELTATRNNFV